MRILPVIGNAAEHATAVTVALKNKMDLSLNVAVDQVCNGKSNWLEGTLLLATYAVISLSFYFHPVIEGIG